MQIELNNIIHTPSLSLETEAFTAELYIDGVFAGMASNSGQGGLNKYIPLNNEGYELIKKAERFCSALPALQHPKTNEHGEFSVPMDLEIYISKLVGDYLNQKSRKHYTNQLIYVMDKAIVVGVPDESFRLFSFKSSIDDILLLQNGEEFLIKAIKDRVIPKLRAGEIILNTNIPEHILKEACNSPELYLKKSKR
jgi:hypothetical protein